jgi:hypothetical protein
MRNILILCIIISVFSCKYVNEYEGVYKLYSIHSEKQLNGLFFLGFGYIDDREYYFSFVEVDGFKKRVLFNPDIVYIKEVENIQQPYFKIEIIKKNWFEESDLYPFYKLERYLKSGQGVRVNMYLPLNSIVKNYILE